ncbi:hypothetical protein NW762_010958 [Fusarium torreyae]|uniref:Methyltransferase domain-containing protein n=1 Tax=Fusarium torreyae TaxID=1237075 RepID=A0A9W8RT69_9HYPO|nr:hypothetical protein NW762_010958 [Fusarium torreyae]
MSATSDPEYILGDATHEVERLQKQHRWIQHCLYGRIVFAPVNLDKEGLRVLDVGCADGTLLRDLQKDVPSSAQLVGADIMKSFFPPSEGNISFQVYDICDPPDNKLKEAFDLTHIRYVLSGSSKVGFSQAVKNLAATVTPGGWLQVQEMDLNPSRPVAGPAWRDVNSCIAGIIDGVGVGADYSTLLDKAFKDAGLENISVQTVDLPMGRLLEDEDAARQSWEHWALVLQSIIQTAKSSNINLPGSTFENLYERFEKEAKEQGALFRSVIVTGQKPA